MDTATDTAYARAIAYAAAEGASAGRAAGSWVIDGNTSQETATAILRGLDDGDPAVLDTLPHADLSGEWADTLTGPQLVAAALDHGAGGDYMGWYSDICDAYESAFDDAMTAEVERSARAVLS